MNIHSDRIGLDRVHEVWSGFGLPPIEQTTGRPVGIEEFMERDRAEHLKAQMRLTVLSVRANHDVPRTVTHALILEGDLTVGGIAARMHTDPRLLGEDLQLLVESGVVTVQQDGSELPRYSLDVEEQIADPNLSDY